MICCHSFEGLSTYHYSFILIFNDAKLIKTFQNITKMKKILIIMFVVALGCSAFAQDNPVLVNYNAEKVGTLQQTPLTFGQKMVLFRVKKAVPLQLMADWISLTETELLGIEVRYSIEDYKSIERDNLTISKQSEKHLLFLMMKYQMLY